MTTKEMRRIVSEGRAEELIQILVDDIKNYKDLPNRGYPISYYARLMLHCFAGVSHNLEYANRLSKLVKKYIEMEDENYVTATIQPNSPQSSGDAYFSDAQQARLNDLRGRRETLTLKEYAELESLESISKLVYRFAEGLKLPTDDF